MKIFLSLVFIISFLESGEVQRIESIVQDIVKLRGDYEECKKSLGNDRNFRAERFQKRVEELKLLLKTQRKENKKLRTELEKKHSSSNIHNETISKYKKLINTKDINIKSLKDKIKKLQSQLKNIKKTKKRTKKIVKKVIKKEPKRVKTNTNHKIQIIKASTFYLKRDSSIYDSIDGKKIDKWEQDTTFTSNQRTNSYIKITGYFTDMKWGRAKKEMWIKSNDVYKK